MCVDPRRDTQRDATGGFGACGLWDTLTRGEIRRYGNMAQRLGERGRGKVAEVWNSGTVGVDTREGKGVVNDHE